METHEVRIGSEVVAVLEVSEKPTKSTRTRKSGGDTNEDFQWDLKTGAKVHHEGPKGLCHATYYAGSKRCFLATKDRTVTHYKLKHLRGLTWEDLIDLRDAIALVVQEVEQNVQVDGPIEDRL